MPEPALHASREQLSILKGALVRERKRFVRQRMTACAAQIDGLIAQVERLLETPDERLDV